VLILAEDFVRHTGGALPIVSRYAIFEGNCVFFVHCTSRMSDGLG
jgi:hypothetical protein